MNVHDVNYVKEILRTEDGEYGDFIVELHYQSVDSVIEFNEQALPENWVISVKAVNDEYSYDSYGNGYTEDAYVILSVTDGVETALYKLPGEYASYEGWTWELDKLAEVRSTEKVVTVWEWTEV